MLKKSDQSIRQKLVSNSSGTALVEFAIVVVPLTYILALIVNFGYAFFAYNDIQNSMIEATRAFTHGQMTRAEAQAHIASTVRDYNGRWSFAFVTNTSATQVTTTVYASTDAFELIGLPYSSVAHYRAFTIFDHTTPLYNVNPFS